MGIFYDAAGVSDVGFACVENSNNPTTVDLIMLAVEKQAEFVFILINVIVRMPCGLLPITFQSPEYRQK
jgi:hypothetical protein